MKAKMICAAALLTVALAAPAIRANASVDSDQDKQTRIEAEQDQYEGATDAYDDHNWRRAAAGFAIVANMKGAHADAALYWLAKTQNNMGQRAEALQTILRLHQDYPKSKWNDDAKALELEVRQSAGQKIEPEHVTDEELKLIALNGLMQSDPDRAIPILDKLLTSNNSSKLKDKALFILAQSQSADATNILSRVAQNGGDPDLQRRAVRYLGINGGDRNRKLLADIYASTADVDLKKSVLKSYMISGDSTRLLALAKAEQNPELRAEAVSQLGIMGARDALAELYTTETNIDVKRKIIRAMFIGGNDEKLYDIARTEPNGDLKLEAIKNLGLLGGERTGQMLLNLYNSDNRPEVRRTVINSLFIQGNAKALVDLARKERDPDVKKDIITKLGLMHSKEASDYLMEYLKD
ncbi:MAG TPA: HEAT repeat domain-containing protein [Thermoanaerobaculia bacterium]|nr:HEAT repeat domain-containing protein [Thermoanaerobaculia bacterium]